jgi:hypothetical protein
MSKVQVKWADENHSIIVYDFERGWSWTEIFAALKQGGELAASVVHRVDVIMDLSNANTVPNGAITQLRHSYNNRKVNNMGVTVLIGTNTFWEKLITVTNRLAGSASEAWQLEFADSVPEAFTLIENIRAGVQVKR